MSTLVSSRSDRETVDESELVEDDESVMLLYIPELCACHHTRMRISQHVATCGKYAWNGEGSNLVNGELLGRVGEADDIENVGGRVRAPHVKVVLACSKERNE